MQKYSLFGTLFLATLLHGMEPDIKTIVADSVDQLVIQGINHIKQHGTRFTAQAGSGVQSYDVNYVLKNPCNRVHMLRAPTSVKYLCRELLAYFKGSLYVCDGLSDASSIWNGLADDHGAISSNYGYYVFHQKLPREPEMTQYQWVIYQLLKNSDSRKAFININQIDHKNTASKDFPCTIGMQFFIKENSLCCTVSSRSTDIFTGLAYDMGFFSLVSELVYQDLKERLPQEKAESLMLGYVMMKTNFTQIYDKTASRAYEVLLNKEKVVAESCMPRIDNAKLFLSDVYGQCAETSLMKWIYSHAKFDC